MPNVPGVDTVLLSKVNLEIERSWSENQANIENTQVDAVTLDTMLAKQKPLEATMIEKLTDSKKDYDVTVNWPDFCGLEAADCATDVCQDLAADMAPIVEKNYKIQQCIEDKFAIEEDKLAKSQVDPVKFITQNINAVIKRLLEKWNSKHVAYLNANSGYNAGVLYPFAGGVTEVPAADYNMSLMPKLMQDMIYSKIPAAFLIDGGAMHLPYINAKLDAGNGEGKGNNARTQLFDAVFDLLGFAKAGLTDRSFLVAPYSYASVTKNYVLNREPVYDETLGTKGMWKYHMPIPKYGLRLDVFHQRVCVDGAKQRYKLIWLFKLHYDIFQNPTGCDLGGGNKVSGIIEYQKQAAV